MYEQLQKSAEDELKIRQISIETLSDNLRQIQKDYD